MAGRTASRDAGVVHRRPTLEAGGGLVAGLTGCGRSNMVAWFGDRSHTLEGAAVMAGRTTTGDASVVHCRIGERCRRFVTGIAS